VAAVSWIGFYAAGTAWLFGLLVPLVVFYFLKLKRPRIIMPSLALWRQVLADHRVNTPFQRFKRSLLLLLQILLLVLLSLAAMQPFLRGPAARVRRIPVLIDNSASMAARSDDGGGSRLDAARERVRRLIDGLLPDQELCLISFSDTPRRCTGFTNDRRVLREALDAIEVEDVPSRIEEALRMTEGLAQSVECDRVLLFSDGNIPARAHFELPFTLDYQRLPAAGPNVGITALSARRSAADQWSVLAVVEGSADAAGPATVELRLDGESAGTEHVTIAGGESTRVAFGVPGDRPAALEVKVVPAGFDALAGDDTACLQLPLLRPLHAYVPTRLDAHRHALAALPGVALSSEDDEGAREARYDLVITDREEDRDIAGRTRCLIGLVPTPLRGLLAAREGTSTVVDWRRTAPLLRHVECADLLILERFVPADGATEAALEELGYEVLVHGDAGPLVLQNRDGDALTYTLLFHTDRSTLPYRVGFPVMVSNLVRIAMEAGGLGEAAAVRTGVLPRVPLEPDRPYTVRGPHGQTQSARTSASGELAGISARRAGYYTIADAAGTVARVGAGLLSPSETTLQATEQILFDENLSVAAATTSPAADRRLWPLLAWLAFGVLLGEWWLFHHRPGGPLP